MRTILLSLSSFTFTSLINNDFCISCNAFSTQKLSLLKFVNTNFPSKHVSASSLYESNVNTDEVLMSANKDKTDDDENSQIFSDFVVFLLEKQKEIISQLEEMDDFNQKFTEDKWGFPDISSLSSGGITRVIQKGSFIEKGACSITIIRNGILSSDRASSIQGRQKDDNSNFEVQEGDKYSAAALSMVLHSRSPMVPTFRSDVRIFLVQSKKTNKTIAWFGGGADLTPYYLFDEDIQFFHSHYRDICNEHFDSGIDNKNKSGETMYREMKKLCDDYFYLPARAEHRGTGGIFFDDVMATPNTLAFTKSVVDTWMPSWLPVVKKRDSLPYTEKQRDWQLLRRGRYLEFNLLYDRGVKFGLATENPRVEGVMVSAPPLIAWEYKHEVEEGSEEERLMKILKNPIEWV